MSKTLSEEIYEYINQQAIMEIRNKVKSEGVAAKYLKSEAVLQKVVSDILCNINGVSFLQGERVVQAILKDWDDLKLS